MPNSINISIDDEFGRLTVKSLAGKGPRGLSWLCKCICGNQVRLTTFNLVKGGYRSCGCLKDEERDWSDVIASVNHELKRLHLLTYLSWKAMLARCLYAKTKQSCYEGIEICNRWMNFNCFLEDMGDRPSKDYSIDRVDSSKGYNKSNCQWLTKFENSSKADRHYSEERNRRVSEGVRRAHAEGRILTTSARAAIGRGGAKRSGRKLQSCKVCLGKSYLPICQSCRIQGWT